MLAGTEGAGLAWATLHGNTVSASVPLGMSLALAQGRLRRGDRVLVIVAASGITVGLATFMF
jgi:3-oxoacyl-[acyl-carrier-protein] synthase III